MKKVSSEMIDKATSICICVIVSKTILDGDINRRRIERFMKIKSGVVINERDDYSGPLGPNNFS
jgi:hypothetical protein